MKVAEEYFQRLVHSWDSLSAVHELDGLWCARAGRPVPGLPHELSEPEHNVHLCLIYLAEVRSGGHSQYFLNPSGSLSLETVDALRTLDLGDLAAALAKASMVFPNGIVPTDHDVRNRASRRGERRGLIEGME